MPALTVILAFLKGGLGWLWEFFSSHIGQLVLVGLVAWFWAGHRAHVRCDAERDAATAAAKAEAVGWETAAKEIAETATGRLVDEQDLKRGLLEQIEAFDKEEDKIDAQPIPRDKPACSPVVIRPCRVDDRFANSVRGIDAPTRRPKARSARGAR